MLKQYFKLNSGIGISIQINQDNSLDIQACKIVVKHNQLDFEKKITGIKMLNDLADNFPVNAVISLNLNGKGVLHKQIEKVQEINPANFSQILPNANLSDFYVQNFISGNKSFISIIRKEEAEKWFQQLRNFKFIPAMLSLGPYPIQTIVQQLNVYGDSFVFKGHSIIRNDEGEWESCKYDPNLSAPYAFKLENEPLEESLLIAYASAFQLIFAHFAETVQTKVPGLDTVFNRIISKKRIRVLGFWVVAFFIVVLLSNFSLLSSLTASNKQLSAKMRQTNVGHQEQNILLEQIISKESQLKTVGWDGGINKAFIIDQLAEKLPEELSWDEIEINPIDFDESQTSQQITFFERTIHITGFSERIVPVNDWIVRIKEKEWIKNVELKSYVFNAEAKKGKFIIVIRF